MFVIIPLFAAFLIPMAGRLMRGVSADRHQQHYAGAGCDFCPYHPAGPWNSTYMVGGWEPVEGVPIAIYMVFDGLSGFLLINNKPAGFLSAFYAISYIRRYTSENFFYTLMCLMIAGMNGVVLSGDLFNLYVFLEISVISSYALVAFGVEKTELEASYKYQVLGGLASLLVLFGIAMIYWRTGP
jgi:multicomponent Na+:H+ antiporter subunit D